jgi:hypothetical protein
MDGLRASTRPGARQVHTGVVCAMRFQWAALSEAGVAAVRLCSAARGSRAGVEQSRGARVLWGRGSEARTQRGWEL